MNLSQLYYFRKLAELQHYTRAAEELFISQPTLSHAIASLEEDLGCELFRKEGRNVRLTTDGEFFRDYVNQSLDVLDEGIAALKKRHGRLSGVVNLGAVSTVQTDYLPAAVLAYRRARGTLVDVRISQGLTSELIHAMERGELDFSIAANPHDARFDFHELFSQKLVVAVAEGHPLASHKTVSLKDLLGMDVYTYREDTAIGEAVDRFLTRNGHTPDEFELNRGFGDELMIGGVVSTEPVVGLVLLTSGLAPYANLRIIPLQESMDKVYAIGILCPKDARLTPAAQDFKTFLENFPAPHKEMVEKAGI